MSIEIPKPAGRKMTVKELKEYLDEIDDEIILLPRLTTDLMEFITEEMWAIQAQFYKNMLMPENEMRSYQELMETTAKEIKRDCIGYIRDNSGERRVKEILSYFNHFTLYPHVNVTYSRTLCEFGKPPSEDWQAFSELLIERLSPLAAERLTMREKERLEQEKLK